MNKRKWKQKLKRQYARESQATGELLKLSKPVQIGISPKSALACKSRQSVKLQVKPCRKIESLPVWESIESDSKTGGIFLVLRGKQATLANGADANLERAGFVYRTRWTKYLGEIE